MFMGLWVLLREFQFLIGRLQTHFAALCLACQLRVYCNIVGIELIKTRNLLAYKGFRIFTFVVDPRGFLRYWRSTTKIPRF